MESVETYRFSIELEGTEWVVALRDEDTGDIVTAYPLIHLLDDAVDHILEHELQDIPHVRELATDLDDSIQRLKEQMRFDV